MANQRVGTLVLEGQDSISFVNSLIRPTQEEIHHFRSVFERIDSQIEINDSATGFTASIQDLNLSFLHDSSEEEIINFNVMFKLNSEEENYLSDAAELEKAVIDVAVDGSYNKHYDSSYLLLAS